MTPSQRDAPTRWFGAADVVATQLRQRIISGQIPDGGMLPKQQDLAQEYGVTKAAAREACRILEAEGLLRVVRGNVGGSVVHLPTPHTAAYTVALVLQARETEIADVALAVQRLEPLVAQLCAERPDRTDTVLPQLELAQSRLAMAIDADDAHAASAAARQWHEALVESCGSTTIGTLIGTLTAIWSSHVRDVAIAAHAEGLGLDFDRTTRAYREHEQLQALIRAGDGVAAAALARSHLEQALIHRERPVVGVVQAGAIREAGF